MGKQRRSGLGAWLVYRGTVPYTRDSNHVTEIRVMVVRGVIKLRVCTQRSRVAMIRAKHKVQRLPISGTNTRIKSHLDQGQTHQSKVIKIKD